MGAAFVAQDPEGQNVGQGLFKLPDYCSNYQAEAVAQCEGVIYGPRKLDILGCRTG